MAESEQPYNYSLDFVGNASSLVPMTKATLSGRDSVSHLINSTTADGPPVNHNNADSPYSRDGRSTSPPKKDNTDLHHVVGMINRQEFA